MLRRRTRTARGTREEEDRRRFPRISGRCVVDLRPLDEDDPRLNALSSSEGLLRNISGGGVRLSLREDPGTGASLALKIHLPGVQGPVIALGRVVWSTPAEDSRHDVGIEFLWVGWQDPVAQERIRDFIAGELGQDPSRS